MAVRTAGSVKSLDEVVALIDEPKLAKLQQSGGERSTFGVVRALLANMCINLHIDNTLTESNINSIARRLTSDPELRWWLTLADIDLLCRQISEGYFGHFYNHFSEVEFNDCLAKYCNERAELHRLEADKTVSNPSDSSITMQELGYSIGPDGRLIVHEEAKERRLRQPNNQYAYKDSRKEDKITKVLNTAKVLSKTKGISLDEAITLAEQQLNQANQE